MIDVVQAGVDGVLVGGTYALLAAGLALIFGVLRVVNFAQADFAMLGMYLVFVLWQGPGLDPLLVVPVAAVLFFFLGAALHRTLVVRVMGERHNEDAQVILTLGLGIVLQNAILLIYSASPRVVAPPYAYRGWNVGPLFVSQARVFAFAVAVLAAVVLYALLQRTLTGRAIRAASEDWEAATYMGVDIRRVHGIAFGLGIALTAVGGVMISTFRPISPFVGLEFIVVMFVAVVLGGLGSVGGAMAGGVLIGLVQSTSQLWFSAQLANVFVFGLFLIVLYVRPQGLFGRAVRGV